ncbi:CLUMA_CG020113, isoform A [Clunio marinus]|uniref:non-specific serine/threonine protein kinase n=1 Tax=Clunio marinus TaxID=568069 RepID=A0A1J1J5Q7_9DIPT|nr:CLUMA_CG020113, isoform A [Clunio marinus]
MNRKLKLTANKPVKKSSKKNGYDMPKPLKTGDVLTDNKKKQWIIGKSIGIGGFGEIYSAREGNSAIRNVENFPFVVKIEPKENGPLFVEMHFYMRNAKPDDIEHFKKSHNLTSMGMPEFIAMGSHEIQNTKHRFIVLPRFGRDVGKIFMEHNKKMPLHTVYRLGWQIVNVLEYIHSCTYVHNDIKGSNLLLGLGKNGNEQVYLLDYGLACHYNTKDFKPDPKKMHNGTIEYTSRDAHNGVPTMRGDFEILAYNLLEWIGGILPWIAKKILLKPLEVQKMKEEFMKSTEKSLKICFDGKNNNVPSGLLTFFKYLETMKHDTVPEYDKIRSIFETGLKDLGYKNSGELEFEQAKTTPKATVIDEKKQRKKPGRPTFTKEPVKESLREEVISKRKTTRKRYLEVNSSESDEEELFVEPKTAKKKSKPVQIVEKTKVVPRAKRNRDNKNAVHNSKKRGKDDQSEDEEATKMSHSIQPIEKSKHQLSSSNGNYHITPTTPPNQEESLINDKSSKDDKNSNTKASLTLKSQKKNANKKTIQLNFNLDVSLDSDLVVVVNRKEKKKKATSDDISSADGKKPDDSVNVAGFYKGKYAKK